MADSADNRALSSGLSSSWATASNLEDTNWAPSLVRSPHLAIWFNTSERSPGSTSPSNSSTPETILFSVPPLLLKSPRTSSKVNRASTMRPVNVPSAKATSSWEVLDHTSFLDNDTKFSLSSDIKRPLNTLNVV